MKLNNVYLWKTKLKVKNRFKKLKNPIYCRRCEKEINTKCDIFYVDYSTGTEEITYICEECNKFFEKQMEDRDKTFKENCPLHKPCCLWCETCEKQNICKYFHEGD